MLNYWRAQSTKSKIFIVLIIGLLILGGVFFVKYEIANYRLIKTQKKELEIYRDSLDLTKKRLKDYISSGKDINEEAIKTSDKITNKLKNDTNHINSSSVSDNELQEFLAKYEKRAKNK